MYIIPAQCGSLTDMYINIKERGKEKMKTKKLLSVVSALAIATSAFAGLVLTANAATSQTTYDFSTNVPASPTISRWSVKNAVDPTDQSSENTVAIFTAAKNSANGAAYAYYDLSSLIPEEAISYTVSYRIYIPYNKNSRMAIGLADITDYQFARYGYSTDRMIGSVGHFDSGDYIRASDKSGNRYFVEDWVNSNRWFTVTDTVNLSNKTYSTSIDGDTVVNSEGNLDDTISKPTALLIYGYASNSVEADYVYIDDLTITVDYPDPETATNIELVYKAGDTEVASDNIDISSQGLVSGDNTSYYIPAYVDGIDGSLYATSVSNFKQTAQLASGTTTIVIPVTLVTDGVYQYAEYDGENVYAGRNEFASNGQVQTVGTTHTTLLTVEEDGIYTITLGVAPNEKTSGDRGIVLSVNDERTISNEGDTAGTYPKIHTYANVELHKGDNLVYYGIASTVAIDFITIVKTSDIPIVTAPTATYKHIGDYTSETGDNKVDNGSAYKLFVTPGTETITSVGVKVNDTAADKTATTTISEGTAVFAIAVNAHKDSVKSIKAVLNNEDVEATETIE